VTYNYLKEQCICSIMHTVLFTAAALTASVRAQSFDCDYGQFTTNNNDECVYDCEYDQNYVAIDTVPFNVIAEECDYVMAAAKNGYCDSLDDLVWPDSCGCPYCKCSGDVETDTTYTEFQQLISKTCYGCVCSVSTGISSTDTSNIAMCSTFGQVRDGYNWADFSCPPVYCQDEDGEDHATGEGWFESTDSCDTFCYCAAGGVKTCETGFANIAGNSVMSGAFWEDAYGAHSCVDTPEDMFSSDTYGSCDAYEVKCGCGDNAVGDVWYSQYDNPEQRSIGSNYQECDRCECVQSDEYADPSYQYAECDSTESATPSVCPGLTSIQCHVQDGWDTDSSELSANVTSEECLSNQPEGWCEYELPADEDDDGNDYGNWGCHTSPFCSMYGANGECFYYEAEVEYEDCDGVTQTESRKDYTYCCNTDDCNFVDVDKSTCTKSIELSDVIAAFYECLVAEDVNLFSDDCTSFEEEEISCDNVVEMYGATAECYCAVYSQLWADANDDWKPWVKSVIDEFMASFSGWNEPLGCDIDITCDVTTEGGEITGPGIYTSSASPMSGIYALLFGLMAALMRL